MLSTKAHKQCKGVVLTTCDKRACGPTIAVGASQIARNGQNRYSKVCRRAQIRTPRGDDFDPRSLTMALEAEATQRGSHKYGIKSPLTCGVVYCTVVLAMNAILSRSDRTAHAETSPKYGGWLFNVYQVGAS